jgi:hypothetical protein
MSDEQNDKVPVSLLVDRTVLADIDNAIRHLPPGWDRTRVFEAGAVKLLDQLARKYNNGKPFPR